MHAYFDQDKEECEEDEDHLNGGVNDEFVGGCGIIDDELDDTLQLQAELGLLNNIRDNNNNNNAPGDNSGEYNNVSEDRNSSENSDPDVVNKIDIATIQRSHSAPLTPIMRSTKPPLRANTPNYSLTAASTTTTTPTTTTTSSTSPYNRPYKLQRYWGSQEVSNGAITSTSESPAQQQHYHNNYSNYNNHNHHNHNNHNNHSLHNVDSDERGCLSKTPRFRESPRNNASPGGPIDPRNRWRPTSESPPLPRKRHYDHVSISSSDSDSGASATHNNDDGDEWEGKRRYNRQHLTPETPRGQKMKKRRTQSGLIDVSTPNSNTIPKTPEPTCYNCGFSGHLGDKCKQPRMTDFEHGPGQAYHNHHFHRYGKHKNSFGEVYTLDAIRDPAYLPSTTNTKGKKRRHSLW